MKTLSSLLFLVLPCLLLAQNPGLLLQYAEEAFAAADYKKALTQYQAAAPQYEQQQQWDNYLKCGVGIANSQRMSGDMPAALATLDAYIKTGESKAPKSEQLAFLYKGKGAVYYAQNNLRQAEINLKKALELRQAATPNNPDLVREHGNLALICRLLNDFNQAEKHIELALNIAKNNKLDNNNIWATLYENAAVIALMRGYYAEASDYIERALALNPVPTQYFSLWVNKVKILVSEKEHRNAIKESRKALQYYTTNFAAAADPKTKINLGQLYASVGDAWALENKLDSATYFYQQAADIAQDDNKLNSFTMLAGIATQKDVADEVKKYLDLAESFQSAASFNTTAIANFNREYAKYYQLKNDHTSAFQAAHRALLVSVSGFDNTDIFSLPSEEQAYACHSLDALQNALAFKARVFYNAYKAGKAQQKELEAALQNLFLWDKVLNRMRSQSDAQGTGLAWADLSLDAYANAMDICWALWNLTKDEQYKHHAFYFTEKSKSLALLEAFQKSKAKKIAGLSAAELEKENSLKMRISELEQELFALKQDKRNTDTNKSIIQNLEKDLFDSKNEYSNLMQNLEKKNPSYFSIKNNVQILDVQGLRNNLQKEQSVLEYFVADSSLYVFKISSSEFELYPISLKEQELNTLVQNLRKSIYDYYLGSERTDAIYASLSQKYAETATVLYQKLVGVAAPLSRRLMIIPSGSLSALPFDALLMESPENPQLYNKHAYLLRKHIVAYCYSATLLQEMRNQAHQAVSGSLLAFAPEFGEAAAAEIRGERFALSPLAYNATEIEKVSAMVGGSKTFLGKDATEANFLQSASQYSILHFATHGMANDKNPDYSLLAFTAVKDSIENEFLYVRELYDMQLNADLVVLSACETGIGKLYRGEGVVSLARGFAQAGAKSIFTTLWSVNDQATAQIIEGFYKYLGQGMGKDEALFAAKNDFIDKGNSSNTHPFLWAPFIMVGDTHPVSGVASSGTPWWYWAAGAGGLLALLTFLMKMRRKSE